MKVLIVLALLVLATGAYADCPFCSGKAVAYCDVQITPEVRLYQEEITVNVTIAFQRTYEPIEEDTKLEVSYYNKERELTKDKYKTDAKGIVKFTPTMVGYHLVNTCGKSILIYVNSTCGDGVCGGGETRVECAQDCGKCGDGICDSDEDLECPDCAVCGDAACTAGEKRTNCLKDCVFCGDGICDYLENRTGCPDDCPSGAPDGCCDCEEDDICDPDCNETEMKDDPDCVVEEVINYSVEGYKRPAPEPMSDEDIILMMSIVIAVLIAGAVIGVILKFRKRKPKEEKVEETPEETKKPKPKKKAKKKKKA